MNRYIVDNQSKLSDSEVFGKLGEYIARGSSKEISVKRKLNRKGDTIVLIVRSISKQKQNVL